MIKVCDSVTSHTFRDDSGDPNGEEDPNMATEWQEVRLWIALLASAIAHSLARSVGGRIESGIGHHVHLHAPLDPLAGTSWWIAGHPRSHSARGKVHPSTHYRSDGPKRYGTRGFVGGIHTSCLSRLRRKTTVTLLTTPSCTDDFPRTAHLLLSNSHYRTRPKDRVSRR
jgi:hypothetical protein